MNLKLFVLPSVCLGGVALLMAPAPTTQGFTKIGGSLGESQRDFRIFNNFQDSTANNNGNVDSQFPGRVGESKEFLLGQARMNLRKVVAGSVLIRNHLPGLRRAAHGPTVQRWSRRNESRTENGAFFEVGAQFCVRGAAEHASDCRDAIRDIEIEITIQRPRPGVRNVRVHLGQPGHQESISPVDDPRSLRNRYRIDISDNEDFATFDNHGLLQQNRIRRHGHHVDIDEGR